MEGHPGYEDRGEAPGRRRVDPAAATRKRAFVLLEGERRSLAGRVRPAWRPRGRYEDLSLVLMLARLERDWLSQRRPHLDLGSQPEVHGQRSGRRLAGWAMPWGAAPRMKLETDIDHLEHALKRLGRWLPRRTMAKAEARARRHLTAITTGPQNPGAHPPKTVPVAKQGPARDTPRFKLPSRPRVPAVAARFKLPSRRRVAAAAALLKLPWRPRVAAVAALLLLGAGSFLIAKSEQGGGPDSVGRPGAGAGVGDNQHATNVQTHGRSAPEDRGPDRSGDSKAPSNTRAGSQRSAPSTSVASEPVPVSPEPPPEPAAVAQPVAAPQPAPAPVSAGSPSSSTSSQAKDAGGCPPEFGFEC